MSAFDAAVVLQWLASWMRPVCGPSIAEAQTALTLSQRPMQGRLL